MYNFEDFKALFLLQEFLVQMKRQTRVTVHLSSTFWIAKFNWLCTPPIIQVVRFNVKGSPMQ